MRKITVLSMITLDGVMQSPGAPEEDTAGGFKYGGWVAPYNDSDAGKVMERLMKPADLLLGRKTFDIWEDYWPQHEAMWPGINEVTKYVLSHQRKASNWNACVFLDSVEQLKELKSSTGRDIQVWGSGEVIRLLFQNDLVDELWLMIHPLTIGEGKKLFDKGGVPLAFALQENFITAAGVIMACYVRNGEVQTGTVGE